MRGVTLSSYMEDDMAKNKQNFLDLIPIRNEKFRWMTLENDIVQIQIDRNGLLDRLVRPIFKTPNVMKIDLDAYGSFIWKQIDGKQTMESIAKALIEQYGDEINPLYERLGKYINILRNNQFIKIH